MKVTSINFNSKVNYSSKPRQRVFSDTENQKPTEKKSKLKKFALLATGLFLVGFGIMKFKEIKGFFNKVSKEIKESPVFQRPSVTEIKQEAKVAEKITENVSEKTTSALTPDIIYVPEKRPKIRLKEKKGQTIVHIDEKGNIIGESAKQTSKKTQYKNNFTELNTDPINDPMMDFIMFDAMSEQFGKRTSHFDSFFDKVDDFMKNVDDVADNSFDFFGDIFQ